MTDIYNTNTYNQIGTALNFIADNWDDQPDLARIAEVSGLSDHHFQRVFSDWVGISPKKFLSILTLEQAKIRLDNSQSVLDASFDTGLSGPSRLHDLFVNCEAMTPGEYKSAAAGITIRYGWHQGPFGETLLMITDRGLCGLAFLDARGRQACFEDMAQRWPKAEIVEDFDETSIYMAQIFGQAHEGINEAKPLRLLLKGTDFQVKVWEALMTLPMGGLTTYGTIAKGMNMKSGAARAVGTAVGMNPISWLIPCHRVIRNSGALGGYRWGLPRKVAMMGYEAALTKADMNDGLPLFQAG